MNILELLSKRLRATAPAEPSSPTPMVTAKPHDNTPPPKVIRSSDAVAAPNLTMEQAVNMFSKIQEMLGENRDIMLTVPCQALLKNLAADLRGPAWNSASFPDKKLDLPRDSVLEQLKKGHIRFPLRDFSSEIPEGWVKTDAEAMVNFDLAMVVEAIPPAWFGASKPVNHAADTVKHIPNYFKPAAPIAPKAAEPVVTEPLVTTPAPVAATPVEAPTPPPTAAAPVKAPRIPRPGEWDGVEHSPDAGAQVVDINRADLAALQQLPGIGQLRAEAILQWRQQHGPLTSIFDLAEVPGIGRKLFKQVTGLTMRRRDRHEILNNLLGLELAARPTLAQLAEYLCSKFELQGCVISNREGMPLALSGITTETAAPYAAIVPQFYRRARRYLKALQPKTLHSLVLPHAEKTLVLTEGASFYLILLPPPQASFDPILKQITAIATEMDWLLGRRAVVVTA